MLRSRQQDKHEQQMSLATAAAVRVSSHQHPMMIVSSFLIVSEVMRQQKSTHFIS